LDAAVLALDGPGKRLDKHRFARAGNVFEQHMPLRQQCGDDKFDFTMLAKNATLQIRYDRLQNRMVRGQRWGHGRYLRYSDECTVSYSPSYRTLSRAYICNCYKKACK